MTTTPACTELVFILDRSGSMSGLEAETIGGFNGLLSRQKLEPGRSLVTTVLFDDQVEVLHDCVPLDAVAPITERDYYVRGCTALLDAVGSTVTRIAARQSHDRPDKTLVVITTDGMENASREYSYAAVKALVERQKTRSGWEFLFLGANIDAPTVAGRFGIDEDRAANYHADEAGTALNYAVLSDAVSAVRANVPLTARWKSAIDKDYKRRK